MLRKQYIFAIICRKSINFLPPFLLLFNCDIILAPSFIGMETATLLFYKSREGCFFLHLFLSFIRIAYLITAYRQTELPLLLILRSGQWTVDQYEIVQMQAEALYSLVPIFLPLFQKARQLFYETQ